MTQLIVQLTDKRLSGTSFLPRFYSEERVSSKRFDMRSTM